MTRPTYTESPCVTALNRVRGMPFAWSLNPYRGCTHGCHYCYARATHAFLGMNAGDDFVTRIVVKTNIVEVLRCELRRPSWARERVAIGTATDPYQPCEGRYRLTRGILTAMVEGRTPASIVTKSTLVLRDLDLLAELHRVAGVTVYVTVITLDREVWRRFEPGTPPPLQRLAALRRLREAGVPAGIFLAPILPGLTDSEEAIEAVAAAAAAHGAVSFAASPLRLAPLVKEYFLGVVGAAHPDLLPRYERAYPGTDAPAAYRAAIDRRIARVRSRHGLSDRDDRPLSPSTATPPIGRPPSPPDRERQLSFALRSEHVAT